MFFKAICGLINKTSGSIKVLDNSIFLDFTQTSLFVFAVSSCLSNESITTVL